MNSLIAEAVKNPFGQLFRIVEGRFSQAASGMAALRKIFEEALACRSGFRNFLNWPEHGFFGSL